MKENYYAVKLRFRGLHWIHPSTYGVINHKGEILSGTYLKLKDFAKGIAKDISESGLEKEVGQEVAENIQMLSSGWERKDGMKIKRMSFPRYNYFQRKLKKAMK